MKNILIVADSTVNSVRALERALRLAVSFDAKLHILHILMPGNKKSTEILQKETECIVRTHLDGSNSAKNITTEIYVAESRKLSLEVLNHSRQSNADLIVMGFRKKTGFRERFAGSMIERIVHKGSKPVLIVNNKFNDDYRCVLVSCDFSDSSKNAFHLAMKLAPAASFNLIHSYGFPDTLIGDRSNQFAGGVIKKTEVKKLEKFAKESEIILKEYGIPAEKLSYKIFKGQTDDVLAANVKKTKADLLTIGIRSRTGFIPFKLGGNAGKMLSNPSCDILASNNCLKLK